MKFKKQQLLKDGLERVVVKFLLFPKTLEICGENTKQTRWLEFAKIVEKYHRCYDGWSVVGWYNERK
ncbi:MAG TPA: hypothetical protein PLI22_06800 [Caldisericia bacterium]|jgi:hypothetical protein|nr:hypothetical protein [Caldisericia bacterium]